MGVSRILLLSAFSLLLSQGYCLPAPLPPWLSSVIPQKGATTADEIKCYSLPYGGIGFLSHFLTYWTIFWLGHGRKPYFPFSKLSAGKLDVCLSILQMVTTVSLAAFTMSRCRSRWQFVLIAVWKLVMSLVVGIWGFAASLKVMEDVPGYYPITEKHWESESRTIWVLIPYGLAAIVGLVGLISLVAENIHNPLVWKITAVFGSVVAAAGVIGLLIWFVADDFHESWSRAFRGTAVGVFGIMPAAMIILCAFYSDWILGALAGSLVGVPSGDNGYLYWVSQIQMEPRLEQADTRSDIFCCQTITILSHLSLLDCRSANVHWMLDNCSYLINGTQLHGTS